MKKIILYHGSEKIICSPQLSLGKRNNDYGKGFYCTQDLDLAKEWACKNNTDGFVNEYEIDIEGLKILDLREEKFNILNWICILVKNRVFKLNQFMEEAKQYLISSYNIDLENFDIVIGYRADDSYFDYAFSFLDNSLSLENLEHAMKLGNLGIQIALISDKAFKKLLFKNASKVESSIYYKKFYLRDITAREQFRLKYKKISEFHGTYIIDLMRGKKL